MIDCLAKMLARCRAFLCDYIAEHGTTQPANLEDDIVGGMDASAFLYGDTRWHKTPFATALKSLVDDGTVIAKNGAGGWVYALASRPTPAPRGRG